MPRPPKYCHHKGRDLAFVKIDGKMIYLGKFDSPESYDEYDRQILRWRERHHVPGTYSTTVGQLCLSFMDHADEYYRDKFRQPTGETDNFRKALRPLFRLYRHVPALEFGPKRLIHVRDELIKVHVRKQVNKHVHRIRQVFKWGVERELVPYNVVDALGCVSALRRGRSSTTEGAPVLPVPDADFQETVKVMTNNVATICQLLMLTGARPSEILKMRVGEIDTASDVWLFRPDSHKNEWRGSPRTIYIGPKGQELLMPYLGDAVQSDRYVIESPHRPGKPYSLRGLESSIRKACVALLKGYRTARCLG